MLDFLNAVLELEGTEMIDEVRIENSVALVNSPLEKQSVMDVWCKAKSGTEMIIEIQLRDTVVS